MLQTNFNHYKSCFCLFECNNTMSWSIRGFIPPWKHRSSQHDVQHDCWVWRVNSSHLILALPSVWWEGGERWHSPCSLETLCSAHLLSQPGGWQKEEQWWPGLWKAAVISRSDGGYLLYTPLRGHGNPLQSSCLENPIGWGAEWSTVHGVTKSGHDWSDWACTHTSKMVLKLTEEYKRINKPGGSIRT